ncbi:MAG: RNA polymerase sigma-70 factor (ECF subfamily) [Candidatus Paceibacteria bacterium]|jgi:RNA polymerase sigma-70 factor (ECF subfamily)
MRRMNSPKTDQAAEIRALLNGSATELDRWYRAQHPVVWRLCLGFLGSSEEAEDAAQEAMLKLHDKLDRWDPTQPYVPWRNTLVLNLCRDRLRRLAARKQAEGRAVQDRVQPAATAPSAGMEQEELRVLIQTAMRALPDREREAFILRELEALPTQAVAEIMAVGESSVRSLLTLARRRLRELLGKQLPELAGGTDE